LKSPFKFLSAYSKEDKNIFFGRDEETRILYDLVKKNRLVLLYGPSGTGKTSLVSCGLAGKFETTDWFPIRINRAGDINVSLDKALAAFIGPDDVPAGTKLTPVECLEEIYAENLRPVYLIFDQFEELFVFGPKEEQTTFLNRLAEIMDAQLPCRVLMIIREEYLARLYQFESRIPGILDRRLRVEPMSREKLLNVVKSSCSSFNIQFDEPEKTPAKIVDNLIHVRSGMALPYLQVYLDMLYKRDFLRTYQRERIDNELPELKFTHDEISQFGEIENVLELFLTEQISSIQQQLIKDNSGLPNEFIFRILDAFVSENGTKRPIHYQLKDGVKTLPNELFPGIKDEDSVLVSRCLKALEDSRVLLDNEGSLELAHDSLAALIDKTRTDQQRQINRVRRRLENAFYEFEASGTMLNKEQLLDITIHKEGLEPYMKEEWVPFIKKSEEAIAIEENLALATERRKRRNAIIIAIVGLGLALIAVILFIIAKRSEETIKQLSEKNARSLFENQVEVAKRLKDHGNYREARDILMGARSLADSIKISTSDSLEMVIKEMSQLANLVAKGDSLVREGELDNAKIIFDEVLRSDSTQLIEYKQQDVIYRKQEFNTLMSRAQTFETSNDRERAILNYQKARRIKPHDPIVLERLRRLGVNN